jgi:hypothetical protein
MAENGELDLILQVHWEVFNVKHEKEAARKSLAALEHA